MIKSLQYSLDVILYMFLDGRSCATLENILVFATGASEVPPLGFRPSPSIQFWDDIRPRSNTCGNVLFPPLYPDSKNEVLYETFQSFMDDAIFNFPHLV